MYKIIFLIDKSHYETKMSRVRFHSIKALFSRDDVRGLYTGPNWENWDNSTPAKDNINKLLQGDISYYRDQAPPSPKVDLVIVYKPLDENIKDFKDIPYKKCIRYNEMYDKNWTLKEIKESGSDIVVCHHYNDYLEYEGANLDGVRLCWVPHSAEETIYKPKPEIEKIHDIGLLGALSCQTILGEHYPLRIRMSSLLRKMPPKYNCVIFPHVGYDHHDAHTDKYAHDFADKINSCKIVITDSGAPSSRFGKYIEIPMCGTAIAGDLYDDHPDDVKKLKEFLIEINTEMSDDEIIDKLIYYIEQDDPRNEKINKGLEYCKDFTQERYAEKFVKETLN